MPIYTGTAAKNVFDLINRDNPGLPFEVSDATFIAGIPKAIPVTPEKHNTQVRIVPRNSSKFRGGITITYRRIELPSLFREIKPVIERFLGQTWYGMSAVLPLINAQLGMNFTLVDFIDGNWMHGSYQPTRDFVVTAKPESLMYVGAITMTWRQGKEELGLDIMTTAELGGALWPSGNDFTAFDDRRTYGTWMFWNRHFTEEAIAGDWPIAGQSQTWNDGTPQGLLYSEALIAQDLDFNFANFDAVNNPKGRGKSTVWVRHLTLPAAGYPELNRPGFSYAAVVYPTDAALYAKYGRAVMYYNK